MDPKSEIDFIKSIVDKTSQRIDVQGLHCVHWGLIVLIWYPLANYLQDLEMYGAMIGLGVGSVALGGVLSAVRAGKASGRLPGENTFITGQLMKVFIGTLCAGMILSGVAPTTEWIQGPNIPILWGLVYANLAFMIGVVCSRDFVIAGVAIFLGSIAAMFLQPYQGYILGPVMGFGMIVPGMRAEARVKALVAETQADGATA